jgi:MFS transporter, PAT family, beta-lactamase induction signal transducer AmpG
MIDLPPATARSRTRWLSVAQRMTLLGSLYFAQGLPYGFFTQAVPALLRKQNVSLSKIGFTALLTLPWALKFLWAPLVDRWYSERWGRRRSWILPMQLGAALTLLALALIPGATARLPMLVGVVLLNLFAATQDIATDGLAVDVLPPAERGFANGLQVAGYRLGMIVGGGVLLIYYAELGDRGVFLVMALFTIASSVPIWMTREAPLATVHGEVVSAGAREAPAAPPPGVHFLRRAGVWRILVLLFLYKAGAYLATGMLRPFLTDAGFSLGQIGKMLGTFGFIAGLLGALGGGLAVTRLGRRRALIVFGVVQAAAVFGFATLVYGSPSRTDFYIVCTAEHFASGLGTASLFTAMMDWCRPDHAATDYTVQASAVVIATTLATIASGLVAGAYGYGFTFVAATILCLIGVALTAVVFPRDGLADQIVAPAAAVR